MLKVNKKIRTVTPHKTASLPIRSGRRLCYRWQQAEKQKEKQHAKS